MVLVPPPQVLHTSRSAVSRTNANFLMNSRSKIAVILQPVTDN
ncbi:hypothetical protein CGMCC3_g8130 [Colletotrichum fructicola]|nr:uncharacterized protein CGMCC3_g8130 [Colletotrichum fructicola]KAE9575995.1 hypothetical protein CGMCC3_g8130 [Colletotrichum fructicola]